MEKFIALTIEDGTKSLINLRHIIAVVEHEGKTYVSATEGSPVAVLETVGDIVYRLRNHNHLEGVV
jgi:hypothetical protein